MRRWTVGMSRGQWLALIAVAIAAGGSAAPAAAPWTRDEAGRAAVADLAGRLRVAEARIRIVAAADGVWADATFGCTGRKPLDEPVPVPGFAFTLEVDGRRYLYRSDRQGRLRRCDTLKPTAPIQRGGSPPTRRQSNG